MSHYLFQRIPFLRGKVHAVRDGRKYFPALTTLSKFPPSQYAGKCSHIRIKRYLQWLLLLLRYIRKEGAVPRIHDRQMKNGNFLNLGKWEIYTAVAIHQHCTVTGTEVVVLGQSESHACQREMGRKCFSSRIHLL